MGGVPLAYAGGNYYGCRHGSTPTHVVYTREEAARLIDPDDPVAQTLLLNAIREWLDDEVAGVALDEFLDALRGAA